MRWIGALFFVAALAIWPGVALEAARGAMEAWATSVAPAARRCARYFACRRAPAAPS